MANEFGSVAAVIVTYNIGKSFIENFKSIEAQVDKVFVVDNYSDEETRKILKDTEKLHPDKLEVIYYAQNFGLAKALNAGITRAEKQGFKWVLLLDHDSKAAPDMLQKMSASYSKTQDKEKIAIIGPNVHDVNAKTNIKYVFPNGRFFFRKKTFGSNEYLTGMLALITSGSLIKLGVIKKEGLFKEEFFIDYIDVEFCLRLVSKGYKLMAVRDAVLYHAIGEKEVHRVLFFKITTSNHNAKRRFTIARNRSNVWANYVKKTPQYIIYDILAFYFDIFRVLLYESDKINKIKSIFSGIFTKI